MGNWDGVSCSMRGCGQGILQDGMEACDGGD